MSDQAEPPQAAVENTGKFIMEVRGMMKEAKAAVPENTEAVPHVNTTNPQVPLVPASLPTLPPSGAGPGGLNMEDPAPVAAGDAAGDAAAAEMTDAGAASGGVAAVGDDDDDDDDERPATGVKKAGRRKINIEFIEDKSRRHITFSKRKAGIMKKAYELVH